MSTALLPSFGGSASVPQLPIVSAIQHLACTASLEMIAQNAGDLDGAATAIVPGTSIAIPWRAGEAHDERIAAARAIRDHGFDPLPHIAARHLGDRAEAFTLLKRLSTEAGVERILLIGGDVATARGAFASALELLVQLRADRCGLEAVGLAAYPEPPTRMEPLETKLAVAEDAGLNPFVMTQFCFDPAPILSWLDAFRSRGHRALVRIGVAGPARIQTLMRYARRCGVRSSTHNLVASGASLARMMAETGPDPVIRALAEYGIQEKFGPVALHFFSFGGLERTARWIAPLRRGRLRLRRSEPGFEPEL